MRGASGSEACSVERPRPARVAATTPEERLLSHDSHELPGVVPEIVPSRGIGRSLAPALVDPYLEPVDVRPGCVNALLRRPALPLLLGGLLSRCDPAGENPSSRACANAARNARLRSVTSKLSQAARCWQPRAPQESGDAYDSIVCGCRASIARDTRPWPTASSRRVSAGCNRGGSWSTQVPRPKTIVVHAGAVQTPSIDESRSGRSRNRLVSIIRTTLYPCRRP